MLVAALVFGIVAALFVAIYAWEKWVKDSPLERRLDDFFDRLTEKFFR